MRAAQGATHSANRSWLSTSRTALQHEQLSTSALLPPVFLCPALSAEPTHKPSKSESWDQIYSSRLERMAKSSYNPSQTVLFTSFRDLFSRQTSSSAPLIGCQRSYTTSAAATKSEPIPPYRPSTSKLPEKRPAHLPDGSGEPSSDSHPNPRAVGAPADWKTKFPPTQWRKELDFNNYSPPLRRDNPFPADAPPLYDDEVRWADPWKTSSQLQLSVPPGYKYEKDLRIVLDTFQDVLNNVRELDSLDILNEALSVATRTVWRQEERSSLSAEERAVAVYVVAKAAEVYVHLDVDELLETMLKLLAFCSEVLGPLPLPAFHSLCAQLGRQGRYKAVLRLFEISLSQHGRMDAEMLHLRLRALIAQGSHEKIANYWELYRDLQVPRHTFDLLLRTQIRRRDYEQANAVLQAMMQHGHQIDAKAWLTILRGHQAFRPKLANILQQQPTLAVKPSLEVFNELLRDSAKDNHVDDTLAILRIFRVPLPVEVDIATPDSISSVPVAALPVPSPETFAICGLMFGRLGCHRESLAFFQASVACAIKQASDTPSGAPFDVFDGTPFETREPQYRDRNEESISRALAGVIQAFNNAGLPYDAMLFASAALGIPNFSTKKHQTELFDPESISKLPKVTVSTLHYKALLECAAALRSIDLARSILADMLSRDLKVNGRIRRALSRLISASLNKDTDGLRKLLRRLMNKTSIHDPADSRDHLSAERMSKLVDLLDSIGLKDRLSIMEAKRSQRQRAAPKDKDEKDAMLRWATEHSPEPQPEHSMPTGQLSQASAKEELNLEKPLTPAGYAMRLRVHAVIRRDYEAAEQVYLAMLKHGIRPNMMHIAPLVEGLISVGRIADAQRIKENARSMFGLAPTLRIHTSFIRVFARNGDEQGVRRELEEMRSNGLQPDESIVHMVEAANTYRRRSSRLMNRRVDLGDVHSVTSRFNALIKSKAHLDAHQLLEQALKAGLEADKMLYRLSERSENWIAKKRDRVASRASANDIHRSEQLQLERALELSQRNNTRLKNARRAVGIHTKKRNATRYYRRQLFELITSLADGSLKERADRRARQRGLEPKVESSHPSNEESIPASSHSAR